MLSPEIASEKYFDNSMLIFNPKLTNDHNTDCASCHIAERTVFNPMFYFSDDNEKQTFFAKAFSLANGQKTINRVFD